MRKPAARTGDRSSPPHTPGVLSPGPGSANVLISGKPAWRSNVDSAVCLLPIAPPAPAPHGPERCYLGSLSVMVNNNMAVRQGDVLIGAGPPNPVLAGAPTVLIGDMGFGLANPANAAEFCFDFEKLASNWSTLTPLQREQRIEVITNRQLAKSAVPTQSVMSSAKHVPGNAQYNFITDKLMISQAQLNTAILSKKGAKQLANSVYHEARHAEQWNLMSRLLAGKGVTVQQLENSLGISKKSAISAIANPLKGVSAQYNLAQASYDSVYGSRGKNRNAVLTNAQNRYDEYRALPEEQDAWNTGDSLPCG